jgi:2-polyprenyl-6-methoxyphenol hydroxylase-like FAD-dependent oxidoreductase
MITMDTNVLIVGAGPVGLALAGDLARYGVSVRIVEKAAQRTDKSKALVLWSRSLELMDRMQCSGPFLSQGLKIKTVSVTAGNDEIANLTLDGVETAHPYALMLPQSDTERLFEEYLNSRGVRLERNVELTSFVASPNSVVSTLRHPDGQEETFQSGWLVGCDGAHSTVRHQLGMEFVGETMPSNWIVADLHLSGIANAEEISIAWHSAGILALFPISPPRWRVIADVRNTDDGVAPQEPTLDEVQTILDERGPGGISASAPIWLTGFHINERKVADYRSGRVFLAGDAAHIHSPAGGQGMNTGIQDAFNLAWKLALVTRGSCAAEPLLDSYSAERSAIAKMVLAGAGRATDVALLRGEIKQSIRNHLASFVFGLSPVRKKVAEVLTEVSIGYPESQLNGKGMHHSGGPAEGERAPIRDDEPPIGAGDSPRFALFAEEDGERGIELLGEYPKLLEPTLRKPFHAGGLWLVRPDGYVALASKQGRWQDVANYLDRFKTPLMQANVVSESSR